VILPVLEGEITLVLLSASAHVPVRTLRRWLKTFRTGGLIGFDGKPMKNAGVVKALSPELIEMTQALAIKKPPMSVLSIHRKIEALSERSSQKPPSYETVYALVKSVSPALKTLAIEGAKVYRQKYEIIFRRECGRSNEIWQTDHTLLDIFVLDAEDCQIRPWLTTVMDDYSRAIAGVFISHRTLVQNLSGRKHFWLNECATSIQNCRCQKFLVFYNLEKVVSTDKRRKGRCALSQFSLVGTWVSKVASTVVNPSL